MQANKENLEAAAQFLNDVASKQIFSPWEFDLCKDRLKYEIAGLSPQVIMTSCYSSVLLKNVLYLK